MILSGVFTQFTRLSQQLIGMFFDAAWWRGFHGIKLVKMCVCLCVAAEK